MTPKEALKALKLEGGLEISGNPRRIAEFMEGLRIAQEALERQILKESDAYAEWISVKERLPEPGQFVLIYQIYNKAAVTIGRLKPTDGTRIPYWEFGYYGPDFRSGTIMDHGIICPGNEYVTHWVPLPSKPQELSMDHERDKKYVKVGSYIPADERNGKDALIERQCFGQGYIFKDEEAYLDEEHPDRVCYIPELSDSLYTRQDFLDMCNGQKDIADYIFNAVDWQHPESYLEEQWAEELAECPVCGKWFWCYGKHYCPYCGTKHEETSE